MHRAPRSDATYEDLDDDPETPAKKTPAVTTITPRGMRPTSGKAPLSKQIRKILTHISPLRNACALDGRTTKDNILHMMHIGARRRISCLAIMRYSDLVGEPSRLHVDSVWNLILGFPTAHVRLDARPDVQEGISLTESDFKVFIDVLQENAGKPLEQRESLFIKFPKLLKEGEFNTFNRVIMKRRDPIVLSCDAAGCPYTPPLVIYKWPSGDQADIKMPPTHANHVWVNLAWMDNLDYLIKKGLYTTYTFTDKQDAINSRLVQFMSQNDIFGPLMKAEEWERLVKEGVVKVDDRDMFRRLRGPYKNIGLYDQSGCRVGPDHDFPLRGTPNTPAPSTPTPARGQTVEEDEDEDDDWEAGTQAPIEEFGDNDLFGSPGLPAEISDVLEEIRRNPGSSPVPDSLGSEYGGGGNNLGSDPFEQTYDNGARSSSVVPDSLAGGANDEWLRGNRNARPSSLSVPQIPRPHTDEVVSDSEEDRKNDSSDDAPENNDSEPGELDDDEGQENRAQAVSKRGRPSLDSTASGSSPPRAGPSQAVAAQASPPPRQPPKKRVRMKDAERTGDDPQ